MVKRLTLIGTSARGANGAPGAAGCGASVMMRGEREEDRPGLLDDVQYRWPILKAFDGYLLPVASGRSFDAMRRIRRQ